MNNLKQYITEAVDKDKLHEKLKKRYLKAVDRLDKARDFIFMAKDEMEKIQVIMKRHGIEGIVIKNGHIVLNPDEEVHIWDRMA